MTSCESVTKGNSYTAGNLLIICLFKWHSKIQTHRHILLFDLPSLTKLVQLSGYCVCLGLHLRLLYYFYCFKLLCLFRTKHIYPNGFKATLIDFLVSTGGSEQTVNMTYPLSHSEVLLLAGQQPNPIQFPASLLLPPFSCFFIKRV